MTEGDQVKGMSVEATVAQVAEALGYGPGGIWATTPNGKNMPLDAKPETRWIAEGGGGQLSTLEVDVEDDGQWVLRRPGEALLAGRERIEIEPEDLAVGTPRGDVFLVVEVVE